MSIADTIGVSLEDSELDYLDWDADVYSLPIVYRDPVTPPELGWLAGIASFVASQPYKARHRAKAAMSRPNGLTIRNIA
ncbi:MAG: hypothetical protein KA758_01330 [Acidimicrobiales bacterium]|nr:hypothetical protein [Acidimicrobiales bacterium]